MAGRAKSLLSDASQDELAACIRLLALSVAHHRQSASFTPLRDSAELLRPQNKSKDKMTLVMQSRDVVAEALELVRVLAAEAPPRTESDAEEKTEDSSEQARANAASHIA